MRRVNAVALAMMMVAAVGGNRPRADFVPIERPDEDDEPAVERPIATGFGARAARRRAERAAKRGAR